MKPGEYTPEELSRLIFRQRVIDGEAANINADAEGLLADISKAMSTDASYVSMLKSTNQVAKAGLTTIAGTIGEIARNLAMSAAPKVSKQDVIAAVNNFQGLGGKMDENLAKWASNHTASISNEIQRLHQLGMGGDELRNALVGTKDPKGNYTGGFLSTRIPGSAKTQSRTVNKLAEQIGDDLQRRKDGAVGYEWVSILDGVTSTTCMALNNKQFFYNRSGTKPMPPQHPNCRSGTISLFSENGKIVRRNPDGSKAKVRTLKDWVKSENEKPMTITDSSGNKVTAWECKGSSRLKWVGTNPGDCKQAMGGEARMALGETRYKLFMRGKLKIERFTDAGFQPLNLETMAKRSGIAFDRAKINPQTLTPKPTPGVTPAATTVATTTVATGSTTEAKVITPKARAAVTESIEAAAKVEVDKANPIRGAITKQNKKITDLEAKQKAEQIKVSKAETHQFVYDDMRDDSEAELEFLTERLAKAQREYDKALKIETAKAAGDPGTKNLHLADLYADTFGIPYSKETRRSIRYASEFRRAAKLDTNTREFFDMFGLYSGDTYSDIREFQRGALKKSSNNAGYSVSQIKEFTKRIEKIQNTFKYDNTDKIYRGLKLRQNDPDRAAYFKKLASMKPGDTLEDIGTTSWSRSRSSATTFSGSQEGAVVLEVEPTRPLGHFAAPASEYQAEEEVLVRAKESFEVVSVTRDARNRLVVKVKQKEQKIDQKVLKPYKADIAAQKKAIKDEKAHLAAAKQDQKNNLDKIKESHRQVEALGEKIEAAKDDLDDLKIGASIIDDLNTKKVFANQAELMQAQSEYQVTMIQYYKAMNDPDYLSKGSGAGARYAETRRIQPATIAIKEIANENITEKIAAAPKKGRKKPKANKKNAPLPPVYEMRGGSYDDIYEGLDAGTLVIDKRAGGFSGSKIAQSNARHMYRDIMGNTQQSMEELLGKGNIDISSGGILNDGQLFIKMRIYDKDTGAPLINMTRTIYPGIKRMTNDYLKLDPSLHGKGTAKMILRNTIATAKKHGIDYIDVHADLNKGGFVWFKFGYLPTGQSKETLWNQISGMMKSGNVPGYMRDRIRKSWIDYKGGDTTALLNMMDFRNAAEKEIIGRAFKNLDWHGTIDTTDKKLMKKVNAYLTK